MESKEKFPHWKALFDVVEEIRHRVSTADKMRMEGRTLAQMRTAEFVIASNPAGISLKEIATRRGVTESTASVCVDALVRAGVIRRASVRGDRRAVKLLPTAKTLRHIEKVSALTNDIAEKIFDGVAEPDRVTFFRVLEKARENIAAQK